MVYPIAHKYKKMESASIPFSSSNSSIYELHVKPTYAVLLKQRVNSNVPRSIVQIENEQNLTDNSHAGVLSQKAIRRLKNSVNWLITSAKTKTVYHAKTSCHYRFKINFVTLTLPTLNHDVSDNFFKNVLLRNFINTAKYKFNLKNYVWKVETQANGNIHAHFTTDCFMHWQDLRDCWNRILAKNGILELYSSEFENLTFEQYANHPSVNSATSLETLKIRYNYGKSTNWCSPNSTDVHAVHKVKDIGAYLAKYMSKSDDSRRPIKGRIWACSSALSDTNKLTIEMAGGVDSDIMKSLCSSEIAYKPLESINKLTGLPVRIGEIFFIKLHHWGTVIKGRLLEFYNIHRWKIRENVYNYDLPLTMPVRYSLNIPSC